MIKKLRVKFVCVVMVIVLAMLGCILALVVHYSAASMKAQSISMMRTIAANPFQLGNLTEPAENVRLPFLVVQINSRGEMLAASGGYFDLTDHAFIQQIVRAALSSGKETGELKDYNLRYLHVGSGGTQSVIFADTTTEQATARSMIYICIAVFLAAALALFGLSVLLSRWAVRPVEQAWTQQRQFVADASHELKTPLSVIMANAELIQDEQTENRDQCARNILTMSYQMRNLVENLLEMARVDSGTLHMHFSPLDMSQLVEDAVLSFQLLYEEQKMSLSMLLQPGLWVCGSEQHLFQVMDVLLDNALKYAARETTVEVSLRLSGRHVLLCVYSAGQPLTREEQTAVFKRFYRTDRARTVNGSYGLGLSIADAVVTAHRGRIWAEAAPGGNRFWVQLPVQNGVSALSSSENDAK